MDLIPPKQINNLPLVYFHQTSVTSQLIYITTLLGILMLFFALPFLKITISVEGLGFIQSAAEKVDLLAPASGHLINVNLKDNQFVKKGLTLLTIDTALPRQQDYLIADKQKQLLLLQADINLLLTFKPELRLRTGLYQASWQQYKAQIKHYNQIIAQNLRSYNRYFILYQRKVITQVEFEEYQFNYEKSVMDKELAIKNYSAQWQMEANQYRNELRNIQEQKNLATEQRKYHTLKATITGSVQKLIGLQVGDVVYVNQKLGEISPDTNLLAYCYVSTKDIALIKKGQTANFKIDAFNFSEWGSINGKVIEISKDIVVINNSAFFKVKCALSHLYIKLKNGYKGHIKKGMGLKANFKIARRSLFQLLSDRPINWLVNCYV